MGQFVERVYPRQYATPIMGLDSLICLIGAAILASPFLMGYFPDAYPNSVPGSFETTLHVTLGTSIAMLAFFRVAFAYGSAWVEVVLFVLGILVLALPRIMAMEWNSHYALGHYLAGGGVMLLSILSGLTTAAMMKKLTPA